MQDKQKATEEMVGNWQEYSEQANKMHQILHVAEEMLPSEDVEKIPTTELDPVLQQAKVGFQKIYGQVMFCNCLFLVPISKHFFC